MDDDDIEAIDQYDDLFIQHISIKEL